MRIAWAIALAACAHEAGPPVEAALPAGRDVALTTEDGVVLHGTLREGARGASLVVLVHQLSHDRREWEPLLRKLARDPALSTFALDMRGHGESTRRADGSELHWQSFETADWERTGSDVAAIARRLREELHPRSIAIAGASIGATAAILAGARDPSIARIVLLSPGRAYRGVDAIGPAQRLEGRAVLCAASLGEPESAQTARDLNRMILGSELALVEGDRHGVAMFEADPSLLDRVDEFLRAR